MNGLSEAERIMGDKFFGPEDFRGLGISFSRQELKEIKFAWPRGFTGGILKAKSPLTPEKRIFQDHFLWMSDRAIINEKPALTIRSLSEMEFPGERQPKIYHFPKRNKQLYEIYDFGTESCRFTWYLSPLFVPERFAGESYKRQLQAIPESYFVLLAVEEVYKSFIYFIKTGKRINEGITARCADSPMAGYNANVGNFISQGIGITCSPSDFYSSSISIAVSHKIACSSF